MIVLAFPCAEYAIAFRLWVNGLFRGTPVRAEEVGVLRVCIVGAFRSEWLALARRAQVIGGQVDLAATQALDAVDRLFRGEAPTGSVAAGVIKRERTEEERHG